MIRRRSALATLALAACALAIPYGASADAIPQGSTIAGNLDRNLDTGKAQAGELFSLTIVRPYPNGDPSYAGATVRGHVARVVRAGQGRKPEIDLAFDSIVLASGASAPLAGHVLHVATKKKTAVVQQAAGAGIGMLVGNFIGKKIGTNEGGLAGAGGGFIYANNLKTNFVVPRDSVVTLQTDAEVMRPQAR